MPTQHYKESHTITPRHKKEFSPTPRISFKVSSDADVQIDQESCCV